MNLNKMKKSQKKMKMIIKMKINKLMIKKNKTNLKKRIISQKPRQGKMLNG